MHFGGPKRAQLSLCGPGQSVSPMQLLVVYGLDKLSLQASFWPPLILRVQVVVELGRALGS